jgi:hypothetical protein
MTLGAPFINWQATTWVQLHSNLPINGLVKEVSGHQMFMWP